MPLQKPRLHALAPPGAPDLDFISASFPVPCFNLLSSAFWFCFWGWDALWAGLLKDRNGNPCFPFLLGGPFTVVCDSARGDMTACVTDQNSSPTEAQLVGQ